MMKTALEPAWRFRYEGLSGYVYGGHEHGLYLTAGIDGSGVTRTMCLNVEHYYARTHRGGRFVPRNKAEIRAEQTAEDTVTVRIAPYGTWKVETRVSYTLLSDRVIEARYDFSFGAAYKDFEVFISNYFLADTEPHVHIGGRWVQPRLGGREHRYWARSRRDAEVIADGRLAEFLSEEKEPYIVPVDPLLYDYPIMITPVGEMGWSVVNMVEKAICPSISANRTWQAHDFSLIGHDVNEGQQIAGRAWLVYTKLESLDEAILLYNRLTGESASNAR